MKSSGATYVRNGGECLATDPVVTRSNPATYIIVRYILFANEPKYVVSTLLVVGLFKKVLSF